jgi:hypothetical protein
MSAEPVHTYQQNPRPVGFPITYKLTGDRLTVDTLKRTDEVDLRDVERVRLTYEAGKLSSGFYKAALRLKDGRTVALSSISWSSMVHSANQAESYRAFVVALIEAVSRMSPQARLEAGKPPFVWGAMAATSAALAIAAAYIALRALMAGSTAGALVPLALGSVMIWQMGPVVWRNRPRSFTPGALPADLLGGELSPAASVSGPPSRRAPA